MDKEQKNWSGTEELFECLNKECNYLVMRNFESMNSEDFLLENHEDIDILCDDRERIVSVLDAKTRKWYDNGIQYYILIRGQKVKIDIRHQGDNYFPNEWERDMMNHRKMHEFGFYIPSEEDYFYTLSYHAILQKKSLSDEYLTRLRRMAEQLSINADSQESILAALQDMMRTKGYFFVYPEDTMVPNRFFLADRSMVRGKGMWYFRKIKHFPIRVISYTLHKMGRM